MSNLYNDRRQQQRADDEQAAAVSPTAFPVRMPDGTLSIYDYGEFAGGPDMPGTTRIEAGVRAGRLAQFDAFLRAQTDPVSRWLLTHDPVGTPRAFNDALSHWVEKWDAAGLGPVIAEFVDWQRK